MGQRVAALEQEFERVVEAGRVGLPPHEIGQSLEMLLPNSSESTEACLAAIQLLLPRTVLISLLWATMR